MEPLPKGGRVIYRDLPYYISFVRKHENDTYSYTLYPFDPKLRTLNLIKLETLRKEMEAHARYEVGQKVGLAHSKLMEVIRRQWDFHRGTVWYYLADPRRNVGAGWFDQETMMRLDRDLDPERGVLPPKPRQRIFPR